MHSNPSKDSEDQRQFHLQLMGRVPSRADTTAAESNPFPLSPPPQLYRQSIASTCRFIDPLDSLTADSSPYHHAMLTQPSASTRPSSRSSTLSSSAHHGFPPVPSLPLYSPPSSLSSHHSMAATAYPSPFLAPPARPSSSQSTSSFDPDYEAERVRLAKLEQRRSTGLGLTRPTTTKSSRVSSASSIASVRSFRSVGPSHHKDRSAPFGLPPPVPSVYRPSPLRSTSTPDLGAVETEAEKKKHRKEMKEEYEKMRVARIEEEKRLQDSQRDKSSAHDHHQSWFASHFKRPKVPALTNHNEGAEAVDERRSTSLSSSLDSTAPSSSALDHQSHSEATVPTSEEEPFQVIDQSQKGDKSLENTSDQSSTFDSPAVDPFRKSMLPGQVPPTPTKITLLSSATPKSIRILTPARTNLRKLNRLFDSFKLGAGVRQQENQENKRKTQIAMLDSFNRNNNSSNTSDQAGWLDSIKSIRSKSRLSRRKTLVGVLSAQDESPPPVPKLPDHVPA